MRLVAVLLALLIVGFLVKNQLQGPAAPAAPAESSPPPVIETPRVPTTPGGLPQFEQDVDQFIDAAAEERGRRIDEATSQDDR